MTDYTDLLTRLDNLAGCQAYEAANAADAIKELVADNQRLQFALAETEALEESHGERIEKLYEHISKMYVGYVRLLENGRDRITMLGGDCDPVDVMEANDPLLIDTRKVMKHVLRPMV